jgi:hypothetical protein
MQKQSVRGRQELLSRHTSRKARTGRHRGKQSGKSSRLRLIGMQVRIQAGVEVGGQKQAGSTGTQRQLGRQKRQGSTVREVSARTQKWGEGREAGRQRLTERSRLEACK